MNTIEIKAFDKSFERTFASSWDELTQTELLSYAYAVLKKKGDAFLIYLFYHWLKLPNKIFWKLKVSVLHDLAQKISFLSERDISTRKLIIPVLHLGGRKYHGPGTNFCNLKTEEFMVIDALLNAYLITKDEAQLNKLCASIYRKSNAWLWLKHKLTLSDPRRKLNDRLLDKHAALFKKMPQHYKTAVMYNLVAFRNFIQQEFSFLYSAKEKAGSGDWVDVMWALAGGTVSEFNLVQDQGFVNMCVLLKKNQKPAEANK